MSRRRLSILVAALMGLAAGSARAQDAAAGAKVFADQKCSLCHSIAGRATRRGRSTRSAASCPPTTSAPGSTTPGHDGQDEATRKPEMKAYTLPKSDVDALVAYLSAMKKIAYRCCADSQPAVAAWC